MRRFSIALALSTLLFLTICSAQQATESTSSDPAQQNPQPAAISNTYIGQGAGTSNNGMGNSFLGQLAGSSSGSGNYNTYVGYQAGLNQVGAWNTYLGINAGLAAPPPLENNTMRLGSPVNGTGTGTMNTYIQGIYGSTSALGVEMYINESGHVGTMGSSLRFKEQVRDMGDSTNALMKLRPVTFFYKPEYANGERTLEYGLIAEEVAKVYPELVAYDKDGKPYAVRYQYIATMVLNEVQKQYRRAEAQAELIKAQQQEIDGLKHQLQAQNATLQERLSRLEALTQVERAAAHYPPQPND